MANRLTLVAALVIGVFSVFSSQSLAQTDPWIGTWKVDLAKSTFSPGPKPTEAPVVKMEMMSGQFMTTINGRNPQGQPTQTMTMGNFDGKDNVVTGAPVPGTTTAYKRIDTRTFETMSKVNGKPTTTTRVAISADGKSLTATVTGTNAQGQTVNNVIVADKQ